MWKQCLLAPWAVLLMCALFIARIKEFPMCKHYQLSSSTEDPCATIPGASDGQVLRKRGFVVVPNVLEPKEIKSMLGKNEQLHWNSLPGEKIAPEGILEFLPASVQERLEKIVHRLQEEAGVIYANPGGAFEGAFVRGTFMTTNASVDLQSQETTNFPWHQDHGFFWETGATDNLNLYMILHKPHRDQAGVGVISFETLRKRSPEFWKIAYFNPAAWYSAQSNKSMLAEVAAYDDKSLVLDFNLDEIACYPDLGPGDMLVLGGGTIHRTQPHNSERISMLVRAATFKHSFGRVLQGGESKYAFLHTNVEYFANKMVRQYFNSDGLSCNSMQACPPVSNLKGLSSVAASAISFGTTTWINSVWLGQQTLIGIRFRLGYWLGEDITCLYYPREPLLR